MVAQLKQKENYDQKHVVPGQPGGTEEGFYPQKDQRRQVEGALSGTIHNHKGPSSWNIRAC